MGHSVLPPTFIAMLGNRIAAVYFRRPSLPDVQFATNTLDHGEGNGNIGCFNAITFQARFDDQFHGFLQSVELSAA